MIGVVIFTDCHFRNTTLGGRDGDGLLFVGCDFRDGSAGVRGETTMVVLTDCAFEDLAFGVEALGLGVLSKAQVCGCRFVGCGQGIVGRWRDFTLIQSTFVNLTGEACFWTLRCIGLVIDLCSFGSEVGRVTLSFAADGGAVLEGNNSITRSCFEGSGQRIAFATELSAIQLAIDPTVCFEADEPFGNPNHGNDLWHPSVACSACTAYDTGSGEGCDRPGMLRPITPVPTPEGIEQFYPLPLATPAPSGTAAPTITDTEIPAATPPPPCSPTEPFIPYRPLRYGRFMFMMFTLAW
jgi:hypothetical protein